MNEPDIQAVNQDFVRYDQVEKGHTYKLAESDTNEFDENYQIQIFDFARYLHGDVNDREDFAREFGEAVQDIGFSILTGHGVNPAL